MDFHDFEAMLCSNESPDSDELGGLPVIRRFADDFVKSGYADRLADALYRTGSEARADFLSFAGKVLCENEYPFVVAAVGQTLANVSMSRPEMRATQELMLARARRTDTQLESEMASECLAAAFLLASTTNGPRAAMVAALDRVEPGENTLLVRRVSLLAGLAWLWDQSTELEALLERLATDADAGEQAAFEVGMICIDRAMSSQDKESLFAGLNESARWFEAAESIDSDMSEAKALLGAVRALLLFCDDAPAHVVEQQIERACDAAGEHLQSFDMLSMRRWLRPRLDVQTSWYELTRSLRGLSVHMSEHSWLRALPVLQQISTLRSTLVALATDSGDALRIAVTNRLASGFAAQEGLRAHLSDWIADSQISDGQREQAAALMAAVETMRADPGKAAPLASESGLVSGTRPDGELTNSVQSAPDWMRPKPFNQMEERCFSELTSKLQSHVDYYGSVAQDINSVTAFLIQFLVFCLNVSLEVAKPTFEFLFQRDENLPLEKELQIAMFQALHFATTGFKSHQIRREIHDVAAGRVDLGIACAEWLMCLELKREVSDASRTGISKYLGQAGTYLLTGARIGFLVVLDLCSQKRWGLPLADNCWVESVKGPEDSEPRMIVVFRIPGMRPVPSDIKTPSLESKPKAARRGTKRRKAATSQ